MSTKISSLTSNSAQENKENVTVIWLNPVADETKSVEEIKEDLRAVNNLLICPTTVDACITEIESRKEDQIFLISEKKYVDELVAKTKHFSQLDSIFIFREHADQFNGIQSNLTKNLTAVKNGKDLVELVEQNTNLVNGRMEVTSFYNQYQRGTRDLSEQSAEFLW